VKAALRLTPAFDDPTAFPRLFSDVMKRAMFANYRGRMKPNKQAERASEVVKMMHEFRDKLRKKVPSLRRIELDVEYESGKSTERIKLEAR
jgi:hypothetical protein